MKKYLCSFWGYCAIYMAFPFSVFGLDPFFVVRPLNAGLFAEFNVVLGALNGYEVLKVNGLPCAGLCIDFGCDGVYYDPKVGTNFWQYYFEPIELGNRRAGYLKEITRDEIGAFCDHARYQLPLARCHELIQKYVRIKPFIQKQVDEFYEKHFVGSYILGVHYRGTDKKAEAPRVSYENLYQAIGEHIVSLQGRNFKLFVASDEEPFIQYMESKFPGLVLKNSLERSNDGIPLHLQQRDQFKIGEGAMLDCLLLSKCDFLVRTSSCLSFAASQFNPDLHCVDLNRTYWEEKFGIDRRLQCFK